MLMCTLAFGDMPKMLNTIKKSIKNYKKSEKKNRKKGS